MFPFLDHLLSLISRTNNYNTACSGLETFWKRHCHIIELIKAKPGKKVCKYFSKFLYSFTYTLYLQLCKAHTCSHCQTIIYLGPENSGYNHRLSFCADGTKQVSKNKLLQSPYSFLTVRFPSIPLTSFSPSRFLMLLLSLTHLDSFFHEPSSSVLLPLVRAHFSYLFKNVVTACISLT
jgi:hypothetical protein